MGWKDWQNWVKSGIIGAGIAIIYFITILIFYLIKAPSSVAQNPGEVFIMLLWLLLSFAVTFGIIGLIIDTRKHYLAGIITLLITVITAFIHGNETFLPASFWKSVLGPAALESPTPFLTVLILSYFVGTIIGWLIGKIKQKREQKAKSSSP